MPTCDVCSKEITPSEMKKFLGTDIHGATERGFVPQSKSPLMIWRAWLRLKISYKKYREWELCRKCAREFEGFLSDT